MNKRVAFPSISKQFPVKFGEVHLINEPESIEIKSLEKVSSTGLADTYLLKLTNGQELTFEVQTVVADFPAYDGEYTVTPDVEAQTLETALTYMEEDLTVKAIPFFNVSNNSGGSTVYIGKEIET